MEAMIKFAKIRDRVWPWCRFRGLENKVARLRKIIAKATGEVRVDE